MVHADETGLFVLAALIPQPAVTPVDAIGSPEADADLSCRSKLSAEGLGFLAVHS